MGKEDYLPQRLFACEQHCQPVYPHAKTAGRWHPVAQGGDIVLVQWMSFLISRSQFLARGQESIPLIEGIVYLAKSVTHLGATDKELEAFDRVWLVRLSLGQW